MTIWPVPLWPKPPPLEPNLAALADAVDAFLCGALTRDGLQQAWRTAITPTKTYGR